MSVTHIPRGHDASIADPPAESASTDERVFDLGTRVFHWVNAAAVLVLIGIGIVILNGKALGIGAEGKILLKTLHVYAGYVFCANLLFRLMRGSRRGKARSDERGRAGRAMVRILLVMLTLQALTGLVLAGTDLYLPPLGKTIAEYVAADGAPGTSLQPGSMEGVDEQAYASMRAYRKPIVTAHEWLFFLLAGAIVLHVTAVVVLEIRQRSGRVSAMISGYGPRPR